MQANYYYLDHFFRISGKLHVYNYCSFHENGQIFMNLLQVIYPLQCI